MSELREAEGIEVDDIEVGSLETALELVPHLA
jgi:hypothetical protein